MKLDRVFPLHPGFGPNVFSLRLGWCDVTSKDALKIGISEDERELDPILEGAQLDEDILMTSPSQQPDQLQETLSVGQSSHGRNREYSGAGTPRGELRRTAIQGGPCWGLLLFNSKLLGTDFCTFIFICRNFM